MSDVFQRPLAVVTVRVDDPAQQFWWHVDLARKVRDELVRMTLEGEL